MPNNTSKHVAILVAAVVAFAPGLGWSTGSFDIDGYYKNFFVAYDVSDLNSPSIGSDATLGSVSNRLRLNATYWTCDRVSFRASYDFAPRVQDRILFSYSPTFAVINPFAYRVIDFESRLYPEDNSDVASFAVFHNLDRAYATIELDRLDLYVGRQPIAFGSARIINPTDVIAPYSYETLDTEDRVGVDAVRARVPIGFMGELDVGYVFGEDFEFEQSAFFVRGKFYAARTDLTVMAVGFRENLMLGVDMARSVGGAGVWLEAAHVFTDALNDNAGVSRDYFRASIGCDYSFKNNTYVFAEYHFNQAGKDEVDDYLLNYSQTAYIDGSVYLLGRHYFVPGMTWEFSPLVMGSLQILTNLSDNSVYLTPNVEYNVAENFYFSGGLFIGLGKESTISSGIASEFGAYPDIYFTSFRYYF